MSSGKKVWEFPDEEVRAEIDKCAACGVCHSVCPVYNLTGDDTLSARGRIHVLKALNERRLDPTSAGKKIFDRCLLCYACATACPSGVRTDKIWIKVRDEFAGKLGAGFKGRAIRKVSGEDALKRYLKWGRKFQKILPRAKYGKITFNPLLSEKFLLDYLPDVIPAKGERRYRVGYFVGCVSNFFLGEIGLAAIAVLSELGCEVVVVKDQVCCGAPAFNNGEIKAAKTLANTNVKVFLNADVDIITSADATCGGSFTHEYEQIIGDNPDYKQFAGKYREIHSLVLELGLPDDLKTIEEKVTLHESCHLRHTQGIVKQPRQILKSLPGLDFVEMPDSDLCCGFGGSYSLFHADDSVQITDDKLKNAQSVDAEVIAAGSPGCVLKLKEEADSKGLSIKVKHIFELIHDRMLSG